ncbi:MAG: FAD-binding oxidoreductase, partial [Bdellovibrionales bacterium]
MKITIQNIQDIAPDLRILHAAPEKKLAYKAGQYINIIAPDFEPRSYSIANAPQEDNIIELHIRRKGKLSIHLCDTLKVGDHLTIEGPFGNNTYKAQCKKPILALAGGSGLTQIKALVEKALSTNRQTPVHLYHGARDLSGLYRDDYFKKLMKKDPRL